jgi:AcrR family transcriptional regulator
MIYYYYPTKDDLFFAVVEEIYVALLADMANALASGGPVEERLRRLYRRIARFTEVELTTMRLVVREVLVSSSRLDRLIERFQRGHIPLVFTTIADGLEQGAIDPRLDPALAFLSTLAVGVVPQVVRKFAGEQLAFLGLPAGERFADQLVEVLFSGIGAEGRRRESPRSKARKQTKRRARPGARLGSRTKAVARRSVPETSRPR